MHVTEQHPLSVNAEAGNHVGERGEARTAHLRPQDTCREARHAGAQQAAGGQRHRRGTEQLGCVLCQCSERARERLDRERFEARERRPSGELVVNRDRARWRDASEETARHAERGLRQQVTIQVMPVGRPHSGGEPHARVMDPDARRRKPGDNAGQLRRRVKGNTAVRGETSADAPDPAGDQRPIVVAGHEDHLPVHPERPADHAEDWLGDLPRTLSPLLEQLHDISEQHKPLDALKRLEQPVQRPRLREDVMPQARSQMKIREHEGRHTTAR